MAKCSPVLRNCNSEWLILPKFSSLLFCLRTLFGVNTMSHLSPEQNQFTLRDVIIGVVMWWAWTIYPCVRLLAKFSMIITTTIISSHSFPVQFIRLLLYSSCTSGLTMLYSILCFQILWFVCTYLRYLHFKDQHQTESRVPFDKTISTPLYRRAPMFS